MKTMEKVGQALGKLLACLGAPQELYYINGPDTLPAPLDPQAEKRVFADLAAGRPGARDTLITHNLRLVVYIAKKFESPAAGVEDMISIGTIGLIKAVSTFNAAKSARLSTYAARCIDNELLMMFRARKKRSREVSLYDPIGTDKEGNEISLLDIIESPPVDIVEEYSTRENISRLMASIRDVLSPREYQVICLRYGLAGAQEQTQREIASALKISRSYVSRIEKNALLKLRGIFGPEPDEIPPHAG